MFWIDYVFTILQIHIWMPGFEKKPGITFMILIGSQRLCRLILHSLNSGNFLKQFVYIHLAISPDIVGISIGTVSVCSPHHHMVDLNSCD